MRTIREAVIERQHRVIAMAAGWFVAKLERVSPNGFPDRLYASGHPKHLCRTCNRGKIILLEWKAPGKRATRQQQFRHKQLRAAGVEVHVVDSVEEANSILGIDDVVHESEL